MHQRAIFLLSQTQIKFRSSFLCLLQSPEVRRYPKPKKMVSCHCGRLATMLTSWTPHNPGRRFWRCYGNGPHCGFVGWVDPPMCHRALMVIPGLLRSMNRLEERARVAEALLWKTKWLLVLSWIFFLLFESLIMWKTSL